MLLVLSEAVGLGVVLLFLGAAGSGGALDWSWLPLPIAHVMTGLSLASRVQLAAVALILITISRGLLRYFQHILGSRLRIEVIGSLQDQLFKQMHDVQLDYLQRERAGALSALVGHYPTQIGRLISDISAAIPNLIMLIGYIGLSLFQRPGPRPLKTDPLDGAGASGRHEGDPSLQPRGVEPGPLPRRPVGLP
jgi:ABC-type multidrug transport system fused ATPase/permease subunit